MLPPTDPDVASKDAFLKKKKAFKIYTPTYSVLFLFRRENGYGCLFVMKLALGGLT